ncbi:MAG: radical SAM protein [Clostridiales bacterium]|nr:radical SAM protein [Clostridiales bacterium]
MDTFVYKLGDALYINLTNQCTNACDFCIRKGRQGMGEYHLWLKKEPTAQQVIDQIGDPKAYSEIVFCGYGEPTIKIDQLVQIAKKIKADGGKVRINTNGHANIYHGRDVVPELVGLVDVMSISLNAPDAEEYQRICRSRYGLESFNAMLDFARKCLGNIPEVVLSVVDVLSPADIEKCRKIAEEVGAKLRVRQKE